MKDCHQFKRRESMQNPYTHMLDTTECRELGTFPIVLTKKIPAPFVLSGTVDRVS